MSDDHGQSIRFERLSDGWLMRDRAGGFMTQHPIDSAQVRAYADFFDVDVPEGAQTDEDPR